MTTADYALVVSIFSAVVALAGFGWNVWSKFIYPKAKLRVSFYVCVVTTGNGPPWPSYLCLAATNFGPTEVTLQHADIVISKGRFRRGQYAIVNPIAIILQPDIGVGPFGGGLPKKLAVGEAFSSYFPHEPQSFGRDALTHVGFLDNFSRFHWAPKRHVAKVKAELDKEFVDEPYVPLPVPKPPAGS